MPSLWLHSVEKKGPELPTNWGRLSSLVVVPVRPEMLTLGV